MKTKRSEPDAEKTKEVKCRNCDDTASVVKDDAPNFWKYPVFDSDDEEVSYADEYYVNCETCGVFYCFDCVMGSLKRCKKKSVYPLVDQCGICDHQFCEKCRDDIAGLCLKCGANWHPSSQEEKKEKDKEENTGHHIIDENDDVWLAPNAEEPGLCKARSDIWSYLMREAMKYAPTREKYDEVKAVYMNKV